MKLFNSGAHTAPLAKIKYEKGSFYVPAFKGMVEGTFIRGMPVFQDGKITAEPGFGKAVMRQYTYSYS